MLLYYFDGMDGAGKSTLVQHLAASLPDLLPANWSLRTARFPGETAQGQEIRQRVLNEELDPYDEMHLFALDYKLTMRMIANTMYQNVIWLCDRSFASVFVYQGLKGVERGAINSAYDFAAQPQYTKIFVLEIPLDIYKKRLTSRGQALSKFEYQCPEMAQKIWREWHYSSDWLRDVVLLDGTLPTETLAAEVMAQVLADVGVA
jgi:thymidylate kinase